MYKGVGVGGGGGGECEAEGGLHLPVAVSSVRDRYRRNPHNRQGWSLAVVWHHPHPY